MQGGTELTRGTKMLLNGFAVELSLVNMCSENCQKPPRINMKLSCFLLKIHAKVQVYIHRRQALAELCSNLEKGVACIGIAL